jgi:hypothetical protein
MSPTSKGCVSVTITSTPTAGGELIVINDINWGDDTYGFGTSGCGMPCPGNVQFVKNLVNFTPSGVRYGASRVLLINDHGMYSTFDYVGYEGWSVMGGIIRGEGYTTDVQTTHAALSNVPADVKVIMLVMPGVAFSSAEINGLKTFASQGGRIIFFGENGGYYSYGLALEDSFLSNMGAVMTNTGACDAPGVIVNSVPHQLTTGIAASGTGGFYMNCVSHMNLGPNDFALMNYGGLTVAAIAKINYTLLPPTVSLRAGLRESEPAVGEARRPMGVSGWTSTGPVPNKP